MHLSSVIAYRCRYCAPPLKHLLSYTLLPHHLHRCPPLFYSSFHNLNLPNLNLILTGNSLFSRMEGYLYPMLRAYLILVASSIGVHCSLSSDKITCSRNMDPKTQSMAIPNVEAIQIGRESSPMLMSSTSLAERFWTGSGIDKNKGMVESLQRYGVISSKKVADVMEKVDRALFVPEGTPPYVDSPMAIGYNATISAPHMHATCLQLLEENLQPGMHALDVGSGTGYLTACFALMVGPEGRAVGVEHIPELVASSVKNIERSLAASLLKEGSLSVHVGDGRQGWPECAPYDAIHVGAAAPEIPQPLLDQLKPGGRMVIPVGNIFQDLKVVDKNLDGSISVRSETSVRYVPLTSRDAQLRGY